MKRITDKNFIDWFSDNFGYGYGDGELYIIPALKGFLEACPIEGNYDFSKIEEKIGKAETWFLMNVLCKEDVLEYGTSPRFGWLSERGKLLKEFFMEKTVEGLYSLVVNVDENYIYCYPHACNCGEKGYVENKKCDNPLF